MSWLTNYVKPKLERALGRETPDNLWHKCRECGQMIYKKEFIDKLRVCEGCGHHDRMPAGERLDHLFDQKSYHQLDMPEVAIDPLKFRDSKRYTDRLKAARQSTSQQDAIKAGHGKICGVDSVVAVQDFFFMGGSMGMAVGEGIVHSARYALEHHLPFVMVTASGGARMQEGLLSLMQMPRTTVALNLLREKGLPYIVVLADPTSGGVSASYAMLGDIHIAEPGAMIAFSGPRVIEQTIRETLPDGFQRAEYLHEHGMVDIVVKRPELPAYLGNILSILLAGKKR